LEKLMSLNIESYLEGLKNELKGALQAGDKDHEKAVKAELSRASGKNVETAVKAAPASTEKN
jgi:hypothetical protein